MAANLVTLFKIGERIKRDDWSKGQLRTWTCCDEAFQPLNDNISEVPNTASQSWCEIKSIPTCNQMRSWMILVLFLLRAPLASAKNRRYCVGSPMSKLNFLNIVWCWQNAKIRQFKLFMRWQRKKSAPTLTSPRTSLLTVWNRFKAGSSSLVGDHCRKTSPNQLAVHKASIESRPSVGVDVRYRVASHLSVLVHLPKQTPPILVAVWYTSDMHNTHSYKTKQQKKKGSLCFLSSLETSMSVCEHGQSAALTHRVVDPALPTAVVVFVLAFEHQVAFSIQFLGRAVELTVHIRPVEDATIFIRVHPLSLKSIVYVETLQHTAGKRRVQLKVFHFNIRQFSRG